MNERTQGLIDSIEAAIESLHIEADNAMFRVEREKCLDKIKKLGYHKRELQKRSRD